LLRPALSFAGGLASPNQAKPSFALAKPELLAHFLRALELKLRFSYRVARRFSYRRRTQV